MFEQPTGLSHTFLHSSGSTQATSSTERRKKKPLYEYTQRSWGNTYIYLRILLTWIKSPADHSREDHHKQWQKFKIARQNRSAFCVSQVLGSKRSLNNHLKQYREMVKDILHSFISAGFSVQWPSPVPDHSTSTKDIQHWTAEEVLATGCLP